MSEHPESKFIIDAYFATEGKLSLTEIENMENYEFEAWQAAAAGLAEKRKNAKWAEDHKQ